ncbi:MAG: phosphate ABC transporter permease PstC, partial [Gemmatimonadota bacterium]
MVSKASEGAREPTRIQGGGVGDRIYDWVITSFAVAVPALLLVIFAVVTVAAWPALKTFGFSFLTSSEWNPVKNEFGAAPAIYGTVVSSLLALLLATPLALGVAIFLSEYAPGWLRRPVAFAVDLLAAIPSVVYGLWGIFVLIPILRSAVMPFLRDTLHLGATPFFSGPAYGPSILA